MKTFLLFLLLCGSAVAQSDKQLAQWLVRFPAADANKDGTLSRAEALAYRNKMPSRPSRQGGTPRTFPVDPGWKADRFPGHAICYRAPEEILETYGRSIARFDKPDNEALRIVGTGHSFMAPGYKTLPKICEAAGFEQPLFTHTGGGITGSARYKWEQENGIFQFDQQPTPKLLAAISNAEWDAMMWGPYFNDAPEYYRCWMDFCLKYHPHMKFYLSDAWPQLEQLDEIPRNETPLTAETFQRLGREKQAGYEQLIGALDTAYPGKIHVLPTSHAMVLAVEHYHRGELPGVEGINQSVGGKTYSLWRDQLGHLGPWFDRLEGYVFYAALYRKSPELITRDIGFGGPGKDKRGQPLKPISAELDRTFRKIAWQAVLSNPLTRVEDPDGDGLGQLRK